MYNVVVAVECLRGFTWTEFMLCGTTATATHNHVISPFLLERESPAMAVGGSSAGARPYRPLL